MSRFDKGSAGHCYPDAALDENNGICRAFNNSAPIYYDVRKALGDSNFIQIAKQRQNIKQYSIIVFVVLSYAKFDYICLEEKYINKSIKLRIF